ELLLATTFSGTSELRQRGRVITLSDGHAVLLRRSDGVFTLTHADPVRFLGLRVPRRAVAPFVRGLDDAVLRPLRGDGALSLLQAYAPAVVAERGFARPEAGAVVLRHLLDLVALVAGASGEAAMLASNRGLRAARLRAIRADVRER